jgi:hypothetical protein
MNSTISIARRKEWLTQSVAVGVGGAAAGGGFVLSLRNPPTVRRFHSFYSTYKVCCLVHLLARLLPLVLASWLLRHKENVQRSEWVVFEDLDFDGDLGITHAYE